MGPQGYRGGHMRCQILHVDDSYYSLFRDDKAFRNQWHERQKREPVRCTWMILILTAVFPSSACTLESPGSLKTPVPRPQGWDRGTRS